MRSLDPVSADGTMPAASVVISAWNRASYLPAVLGALARQTFPGSQMEVILVDDGSTDGTAEVVKRERYPFQFRYRRLERESDEFWKARVVNEGLRAATGRIVIYLDADIIAAPELIAAHVGAHDPGGPDRVGIGHIYSHSGQPERALSEGQVPPLDRVVELLPDWFRRIPAGCGDPREVYYRRWPDFDRCPVRWISFWGGNVSVPRSLLLALGGFDDEIRGWGCEDTEMGYRLHRAGARYVSVPLARGLHYPHPTRPSNVAEALRNIRRLLRRYPALDLELSLWICHFAPQEGDFADGQVPPEAQIERALDFLIELEPALARCREAALANGHERAALPGDVQRWLTSLDRGRTGWFGPWQAQAELRPARISDPFSDGRREPDDRLLGLVTGLEDESLAVAVAADHWRWLPPVAVRGLARELTRVSRRCFFLSRAPQADLSAHLGRPFRCTPLKLGGETTVFEVERRRGEAVS